ncbi:MAG: WYL domain-containing protein, partial [Actinobacteria bacterium]|nr:WYL domain-containing protein [Actinomycetota bacterium]
MARADAQRPRVPGERRVFSLVLALVSSPNGLTKREMLSTVYGYADRYRAGVVDPALERQFERDKDQLRELGIPIETIDSPLESGNNQLSRYRISKRLMQMPGEVRFDARELALLRLAALAWRDGSLTAESRRSAMKLEAMGAGLDVQYLGIAPRLGMPEPSAPKLQRGIDQRLVARFEYQMPDRDAPLGRRVAPLRLHRAEGRWHLIAHDLDRGQERVFLLTRIAGQVSLESASFDEELFARVDGVIAELLELERTQRVVVRAAPGSIAEARLSARGGSGVAVATSAGATSAGANSGRSAAGAEIEFGTLDLHELAVELAGFGADVTVISPSGLRDAVAERLERVRDQHSGAAEGGIEASARERTSPSRAGRRAPSLDAPDRVMLLLSLVPYLREHGDSTLAELASVFEVDTETLRGLIEFLGTAGIPGETSTYQDEDLFDIDWDALESDDVVRLTRVVAVDDTPRFSAAEQAALIAGLHSLVPLLPESERAHALSAAEKLGAAGAEFAGSGGISVTADPEDPRIAVIAGAIDAGVRLAFVYRDLNGNESSRTVEPLALTQSNRGWYLRGYCLDRDAERTFLLDSVRDLRALDAPAEHRPAPGEPSRIGYDQAGVTASVRVREASLHRTAGFALRAQAPAEPGWLQAAVQLNFPAAAVRLVQSAPGEIVILAPEHA